MSLHSSSSEIFLVDNSLQKVFLITQLENKNHKEGKTIQNALKNPVE